MDNSSIDRITQVAEDIVQSRLPDWLVDSYIQRGVFGATVLLKSVRGKKLAALKVLNPDYRTLEDAFDEQNIVDRFRREVRVLGQLNHPNIPGLITSDVFGDPPWYLMRYLAGKRLEDNIRAQGALKVDKWFLMADELLSALEHAHEHGLVHRDLNPGNVVLTGHGAMLIDFGIVARLDREDLLVSQPSVVGPLEYRSPEQILKQPIDGRSDVFSLGTLLAYAAKGGRGPWMGQETLILDGDPDYSGLTGEQQALLLHMHTRDAEFRPTASEARDLLRDLFRMPRLRRSSRSSSSSETKLRKGNPSSQTQDSVDLENDWGSLRDEIYLFLFEKEPHSTFVIEFDSLEIANLYIQGFWEPGEGHWVGAGSLGLVPSISPQQHQAFVSRSWAPPCAGMSLYKYAPGKEQAHPVLITSYVIQALRDCYGLKQAPKIRDIRKAGQLLTEFF